MATRWRYDAVLCGPHTGRTLPGVAAALHRGALAARAICAAYARYMRAPCVPGPGAPGWHQLAGKWAARHVYSPPHALYTVACCLPVQAGAAGRLHRPQYFVAQYAGPALVAGRGCAAALARAHGRDNGRAGEFGAPSPQAGARTGRRGLARNRARRPRIQPRRLAPLPHPPRAPLQSHWP